MTRPWNTGLLALFCFGISLGSAFAETIELVTYYPTSSSNGDLHAKSLTVGTAYNGVTPPDGTAIISGQLGIGTNAPDPQALLHVVGADNAGSKVLFMPGAGTGTISVGIGMLSPSSLLGLGVDTRAAGTRQAITIGNAGLGTPTGEGVVPPSAGDKLVMWNEAATNYKAAIGLNANNELWLQSSGNNATNKITFYTSNNSATPSQRMVIDPNGNVGIGTANPTAQLEVNGQVKITGGAPGAGKLLTSDANGLDTWSLGGGSGAVLQMKILNAGTGSTSTLNTWLPAGNIISIQPKSTDSTLLIEATLGAFVQLAINFNTDAQFQIHEVSSSGSNIISCGSAYALEPYNNQYGIGAYVPVSIRAPVTSTGTTTRYFRLYHWIIRL